MAEPSKPKSPRSTGSKTKPDKVEDAVVVDETAPDAGDSASGDTAKPAASATEAAEKLEEAIAQGDSSEAPTSEDDPENAPLDPSVSADEPVSAASEPIIAAAPPPQRKSGFFQVFLGGVVAAGIGAGALYLAQDQGWLSLGGTQDLRAEIDLQRGEIAVLKAALTETSTRIKALETAEVDGAAIDASLGALKTTAEGNASALAATNETVATLGKRIKEVETQPIPKAELPAEVVAAYEARLAEMMGTVDTRFGAMQTALDGKLAEIAAASTAASQSEEQAQRAADLAEARGALSRITVALENGTGFSADLSVLSDKSGLAAPAALSTVAADGAPTLAALKSGYPDAARAALTAATRAAAADGTVSPLSAFLRTQLGARSLEPREGDDADAVLSRAEAAVATGDLDSALAEIASLPQVAQDALAVWVSQAETRRAALAAAADLSAQLNN